MTAAPTAAITCLLIPTPCEPPAATPRPGDRGAYSSAQDSAREAPWPSPRGEPAAALSAAGHRLTALQGGRGTLERGDLAPVVDLELIGRGTIGPELLGNVRVFLAELERHYGIKPILYTAPNFWDEHMGPGFGDYPLWVAEYGVEAPRLPQGWSTWHLWQWDGDALVGGVARTADLSRANRTGADLSALVIR